MTYIGPPFPWQLQTMRDAWVWVAWEHPAEMGTAASPPQWPWGETVPVLNQDQLYLPERQGDSPSIFCFPTFDLTLWLC